MVPCKMAPNRTLLDVEPREAETMFHPVAVFIEEREGWAVVGRCEGAASSTLSRTREILKREGVEVEVMHRRRPQVGHSGRRR